MLDHLTMKRADYGQSKLTLFKPEERDIQPYICRERVFFCNFFLSIAKYSYILTK